MKFVRASFLLFAVLMWDGRAFAETVEHLFLSQTNLSELATQGVCASLDTHRDAWSCNPGLFGLKAEPSGTADFVSKFNEDAYRYVYKVLYSTISSKDIRELFAQRNFLSYSGYATLAATTPWLSIHFTPFGAVGAYALSNPSLPEIHFNAIQYRELRLTSGTVFKIPNAQGVLLGVGLSPFWRERKHSLLASDLISILTTSPKRAIRKSKDDALNSDVGFWLGAENPGFPAVAFTLRNAFSQSTFYQSSNDTLSLEKPFSRQSSLSFAWTATTRAGLSSLGMNYVRDGFFEQGSWQEINAMIAHRLGLLRGFLAGSESRHSFGFLFDVDFYHVGIVYANEKQPSALQLDRTQEVYVSLGAAL